jgi:hypothetical protein
MTVDEVSAIPIREVCEAEMIRIERDALRDLLRRVLAVRLADPCQSSTSAIAEFVGEVDRDLSAECARALEVQP